MSSSATFRQGIYQSAFARKVARWLEAMPHPALALEISQDRVAAARWTRTGGLDSYAIETLPNGALLPSAVETNIVDQTAVKGAVAGVMSRLRAKDEEIALIRAGPGHSRFRAAFRPVPAFAAGSGADAALEAEEERSIRGGRNGHFVHAAGATRRRSRCGHGFGAVAHRARVRRACRGTRLFPGVILSSSLAAITLLDDHHPTLLARVSGLALTTAIVREGVLCGYRCTELPAQSTDLTPQMLLEEIYPVAAYYQDTWREGIQQVRVAGLGPRLNRVSAAARGRIPVRSALAVAHGDVRRARAGERPRTRGPRIGRPGRMDVASQLGRTWQGFIFR